MHIALRLWALEVHASLLQGGPPGHSAWPWAAMVEDARSLCWPGTGKLRSGNRGSRADWEGIAGEAQAGSPGAGKEPPSPTPCDPPGTEEQTPREKAAPREAAALPLLRACEGIVHLLLRALADGARPDLRKARLGDASCPPAAPAPGVPEEGGSRARGSLPVHAGTAGGETRVWHGSARAIGSGVVAMCGPPSAAQKGSRGPSADESTFLAFVRSLGSAPAELLEGCVERVLGETSCAQRGRGGGHGAVDLTWGDWLALVGAGSGPVVQGGPLQVPETEAGRGPWKGPGSTLPTAWGGVQASLEDLLSPILQPQGPGAHEVGHGRSATSSGEVPGEQGAAASAPLPNRCGHAESRDGRHLLRHVLVHWCLKLSGAFVDSVHSSSSRRFAEATLEQQRLLVEIRCCREAVESGMQALHRQEGPGQSQPRVKLP